MKKIFLFLISVFISSASSGQIIKNSEFIFNYSNNNLFKKNNYLSVSNISLTNKKYSYEELKIIREKIFYLFEKTDPDNESVIFGIAIEDKNNVLIIRSLEKNINFIKNKIQESGIDLRSMIFEKQNGPNKYMEVIILK